MRAASAVNDRIAENVRNSLVFVIPIAVLRGREPSLHPNRLEEALRRRPTPSIREATEHEENADERVGLRGVIGAAGEGEWGAAFGALLIGGGGGWAFGTAWWKALRRMRGHRRRVQQARAALRQTGQLPEA
jgi:hypothetical protein